jgi:glucose-1-phosphate cytidylyltransferase
MQVAFLVGGRGTRLSGGDDSQPKALFEIGGRPIIWHIMKMYAAAGFRRYTMLLGYRAQDIVDYCVHRLPLEGRDMRVHVGDGVEPQFLDEGTEGDWQITLCHTGLNTEKGERVRHLHPHLGSDEHFMVTYGDGLSDLNLRGLVDFHLSHGKVATLTAIRARSQFGHVQLADDGQVTQMQENPLLPDWINGGFFVFRREIFNWLEPGDTLETGCFRRLAEAGELMAYRHEGFWACMDTYKDNLRLNELWDSGQAPWAPGRAD